MVRVVTGAERVRNGVPTITAIVWAILLAVAGCTGVPNQRTATIGAQRRLPLPQHPVQRDDETSLAMATKSVTQNRLASTPIRTVQAGARASYERPHGRHQMNHQTVSIQTSDDADAPVPDRRPSEPSKLDVPLVVPTVAPRNLDAEQAAAYAPLPEEIPPPNDAGSKRGDVVQPLLNDYQSGPAESGFGRDWLGGQASALQEQPWWDEQVRLPLNRTSQPLRINIAALSEGALRNSSHVRVISAAPSIRRTELVQQVAEFDWRAFLESTFDDSNDPVGSTLTTGTNANRFKDREWSLEAGGRRRNTLGGDLEVVQRFGYQNNNSRFLIPNPQRTARLELQYTQPLLKGAGRAYNESRIVVAQIQVNQSNDEVAGQLEAHLVEVTEAYWELYRARAEFLQRHKLLAAAESILVNLEARREVDSVERQVLRARTAVAKRKSEMIRAGTVIRNWESRLRLLVNDPVLVQAGRREFTPLDSPLLGHVPLDMSESLHTALLNRPDISVAVRDVRRAGVELGVAEQDILPKLDLVASTYVAGLSADRGVGRAPGDQFSEGRPSYTVGLQFEIPIGNRAARAATQRRQLEMARAMDRYRLAVEESLTSVEIAVREVETSYREMIARYEAMNAAESEALYLEDRWKVLPGVNDSAAQLLDNLLDAQERVANEEETLVRAQVGYAVALVRLKSEMGTLLRID